jgi:hypothetical protein
MRALLILLALLSVVAAAQAADAVNGRILKVLPFLLDQQGRNAKSPSLYDRDAYQAFLRQHPGEVSAMRFDILWKAAKSTDENIKIAIELRGTGTNSVPTVNTLETNVVPGNFRQWTAVPLAGDNFKTTGLVTAWRVRLWNHGEMLGEQKSFLW